MKEIIEKDIYQERYQTHQQKKKECLQEIIKNRHSDRVFSNKIIEDNTIKNLILDTKKCPSSCNRQAINFLSVISRDYKDLLGGVLVGGVGWIHRASHILLIFADPLAYKANNEKDFMPYLDAGIVVQQLYLTTTSWGLKCCFVNPNIRDFNKRHFEEIFSEQIFCGAFAIGYTKGTI